jgi:hypothetical protein
MIIMGNGRPQSALLQFRDLTQCDHFAAACLLQACSISAQDMDTELEMGLLSRIRNKGCLAAQYRHLDSGVSHNRPPPIRQVYAQATIRQILKTGQPVRMIEIGAWCGFSTVLWAEAIARFGTQEQIASSSIHCIDPWNSYFSDVDLGRHEHYRNMDSDARSGAAFDVFIHNIAVAQREYGVKIGFERGGSQDVLPTVADRSKNLIYIDGSHYYEDVRFDIIESSRIVVFDGYIAGDDLERQIPQVSETEVRAHLDQDFVPDDGHFYHPGVTLAVYEIIGSASSYDGYWITQKTEEGFRPVKLTGWRYFAPGSMSTGDRKRFVRDVAPLMSKREPGPAMWLRRIAARTVKM